MSPIEEAVTYSSKMLGVSGRSIHKETSSIVGNDAPSFHGTIQHIFVTALIYFKLTQVRRITLCMAFRIQKLECTTVTNISVHDLCLQRRPFSLIGGKKLSKDVICAHKLTQHSAA